MSASPPPHFISVKDLDRGLLRADGPHDHVLSDLREPHITYEENACELQRISVGPDEVGRKDAAVDHIDDDLGERPERRELVCGPHADRGVERPLNVGVIHASVPGCVLDDHSGVRFPERSIQDLHHVSSENERQIGIRN